VFLWIDRKDLEFELRVLGLNWGKKANKLQRYEQPNYGLYNNV